MLARLAAGTTAPAASGAENPPPDWKGRATDTARPEGGVHVADFGGKSSHLGRFTAAGYDVPNPVDLTFVGLLTWTAADGDEPDVN